VVDFDRKNSVVDFDGKNYVVDFDGKILWSIFDGIIYLHPNEWRYIIHIGILRNHFVLQNSNVNNGYCQKYAK